MPARRITTWLITYNLFVVEKNSILQYALVLAFYPSHNLSLLTLTAEEISFISLRTIVCNYCQLWSVECTDIWIVSASCTKSFQQHACHCDCPRHLWRAEPSAGMNYYVLRQCGHGYIFGKFLLGPCLPYLKHCSGNFHVYCFQVSVFVAFWNEQRIEEGPVTENYRKYWEVHLMICGLESLTIFFSRSYCFIDI